MARSDVLLKPNVSNILLFNFCEQKFVQHGPIKNAIDCNGLSLLIWLWTKIRTKQWLVLAASVFCAPNVIILLVYIPAKIKISFIWKDDFFFLPKSPSSVSRSIAIFPSDVQAYTQPYSFGGRIKVIICQIRHELSVTIHEISTSWTTKKKKR